MFRVPSQPDHPMSIAEPDVTITGNRQVFEALDRVEELRKAMSEIERKRAEIGTKKDILIMLTLEAQEAMKNEDYATALEKYRELYTGLGVVARAYRELSELTLRAYKIQKDPVEFGGQTSSMDQADLQIYIDAANELDQFATVFLGMKEKVGPVLDQLIEEVG